MAKMNLNLVLANTVLVVKATKLGCDAVAMNSGRGMLPTLSPWRLVSPRFAVTEPPHEHSIHEEPASTANRPGSQVLRRGRIATTSVTCQTNALQQLSRVSDKGLSERGMPHRLQRDHDYPSQDRHDATANRGFGRMQPKIGLAFNTGCRK